jgi:hypothetical protein
LKNVLVYDTNFIIKINATNYFLKKMGATQIGYIL